LVFDRKKQKKKPGTTPSAPPDKKAVVPPPAPVAPAKPVAPPAGKDAKSSLQIPNNQSGDVRPHTRSDNPAEEADKYYLESIFLHFCKIIEN
jgi:hypothetical protein